MIHTSESFDTGLQEIHDLYQRSIATALAGFVHIDLTIPSQSQVANEVIAAVASDLDILSNE